MTVRNLPVKLAHTIATGAIVEQEELPLSIDSSFNCISITPNITNNFLCCATCGGGGVSYRFATRRFEMYICQYCRQELWDLGFRGFMLENQVCVKQHF